jgi:hypothetical protein
MEIEKKPTPFSKNKNIVYSIYLKSSNKETKKQKQT